MRGSIKGRHRKRFISVPVPKLHSCGSNPTSGGTNFPEGAQSFSSPAKKQIAAEQEAYAYTIRAVARANASCAEEYAGYGIEWVRPHARFMSGKRLVRSSPGRP